MNAPSSASDWGTLLSAGVSIIALGALLTTLGLQREELGLQRIEIARLASTSQEQTLHAKRQTLIESYRGLDEKIDQVLGSAEFRERIESSMHPNSLTGSSSEIGDFPREIASVSFQGVQNIDKYRFLTASHTFPISFAEADAHGGAGDWHEAEFEIIHFMVMSGVADAASMVKHIYGLARDLDLLEYARTIMERKCKLEPLLYVSSEWKRVKTTDFLGIAYINPSYQEPDVRQDLDYHVKSRVVHYNIATSILSGRRFEVSIFSSDAERPVDEQLIEKFPPLETDDDDGPF